MMTTAEAMAQAVLRGDKVAARGLADLLYEEETLGKFRPVVRVLGKNVRAVLTTHPELGGEVEVDVAYLKEAVSDFLSGKARFLAVSGMKVELYEFPDE